MTPATLQFVTRRREGAKARNTPIFAPSRLRVNPFSRHPREPKATGGQRGGPTPDQSVYTRAPVKDSRVRGNDEVWNGRVVHSVSSCLRASQSSDLGK
jgi:hypothetical protein